MTSIPELVARLIAISDGNAEKAAERIGTSTASLSRWKDGLSRPRKQLEERLRTIVDGADDLVALSKRGEKDARLERLEEAISGTLHALREEFHRTASVTRRQEVLDLVAALFFAHVTSIDRGGSGIGVHLFLKEEMAVPALNRFVSSALDRHLPKETNASRFFTPLTKADERFAERLIHIFERDASAFRDLHEAGRDDLINEVFSRFMSTSFVDEKEMGQYLTPTEIVRFMIQVGFQAMRPTVRERFLSPEARKGSDLILDPSCGVGSFLAESVRFCHARVRQNYDGPSTARWLREFVANSIVGIDKSERMARLATINLGLFGVSAANLERANGLARSGSEGKLSADLEGRVQLILTNPPFGATYSGDEISKFVMGNHRSKAESEVLFLERYLDWLAPGGVVVSIVPDSILVNRGAFAQLRSLLRAGGAVEAVFSLPPVTFAAAGTSTKTSVLVLRKHDGQANPATTFFGEAREVGFNVFTRNGQRRRIRSPRNDLTDLLAAYSGQATSSLGKYCSLAADADRWDAPYHIGLPDNVPEMIEGPHDALLTVADVAKLVDVRIDPRRQKNNDFDYIEISDVGPSTGLVGSKRTLSAEAPSRARKVVKAGDVLVSTVRPERGAVGVVPLSLNGAICSTGFAVLRCTHINPVVLSWLLKTESVRKQMIRNNIGIAYPAISEKTCLELRLPVTQSEVEKLSAKAEKLASAQAEFEEARRSFAEQVSALERARTDTPPGLGQIPNVFDTGEPSAIPDVA